MCLIIEVQFFLPKPVSESAGLMFHVLICHCLTVQISMSVSLEYMSVMTMPHVPTLLVVTSVPVTLASLGTAGAVKVMSPATYLYECIIILCFPFLILLIF